MRLWTGAGQSTRPAPKRGRSWRIGAGGVAAIVLLACTYRPARDAEPDRWSGPVAGVCSVERLPSAPAAVPGDWVELEAIDPTARHVGGRQWLPTGDQVAVMWDSGVPRVLDGGPSGSVVAINSRGWAVGWTDGPNRYWVSTGAGGVMMLPPLEGYQETLDASDINDLGEVVGLAHNPATGEQAAVVWSPAPDGTFTPRLLAGPSDVVPRAILDDGTVLGLHALGVYLWEPDGSGRELTLPEGVVLDRWFGHNGDWILVGAEPPREDSSGLARWNVRTGEVSFVDYFNFGKGLGNPVVSPRGLAYAGAPAILVLDGEAYELPAPPELRGGWVTEPAAINDDGTVVAGVARERGDSAKAYAVLWRC